MLRHLPALRPDLAPSIWDGERWQPVLWLGRSEGPILPSCLLPSYGPRRLVALPRYMGGAGRHSRTNVSRSPRGVVPFTAVAFACTRIMPVVLPLCAP